MKNGFTLVELIVAMGLSATIGVLAYGFFGVTSDSLGEVDSLTDVNAKNRFAIEHLRSVLQMAGSGGSPDAPIDESVQPRTGPQLMMQGIVLPSNSDGNRGTEGSPVAAIRSEIAAANTSSSFDSFIVMGNYDLPQSFEVLAPPTGGDEFRIMGHARGLDKLFSTNPFKNAASTRTWADMADRDSFYQTWQSRILRVTDRGGKIQFMYLNTISPGDVASDGFFDYQPFTVFPAETTWGARFKNTTRVDDPAWPNVSQTEVGLEPTSDTDMSYDAALIDAYWYHVIPNPERPDRMILVRDRMCVAPLADSIGGLCTGGPCPSGSINAEAFRAQGSSCGAGSEQRVVITNNVADFQVWFDCGTDRTDPVTPGAVVGSENYTRGWDVPGHQDCSDPTAARIGQARVAHVRLSVHAENERPNLRHTMFENATGHCQPTNNFGISSTAPPGPGVCDDATLKTFDLQPRLDGSAPVVTMQADVELVNFSYRNL